MSRTIQDQDLQLWEVYANSGEFGSADRAKMVFQCLTEPSRRARVLHREAKKSEVEQELSRLSDTELADLLSGAEEVR